MKAVSWCDGDLAQIDNVVSDESLSLYRDNMIIACKQNAIENHPLKNRITKSFKNLQEEGRLCLKSLKTAHLIDFISSVPEMTAKAVTRNNIIHGFKANGMIDEKYGKFPV